MADTVIQGPPLDPLDEFRSMTLPVWARVGEFQDVIYEVAEGIARITINRPEVRNAFVPAAISAFVAMTATWAMTTSPVTA